MECLRGLGNLCGSILGLHFHDESSRQECTSSPSNVARLHCLPEEGDAIAPAPGHKNFVEEQLPVGSSGISFNSMISGRRDADSQSSNEELPAKKDHKEHLSRLEEFMADVAKNPRSLRRLVQHRRDVMGGVRESPVQNMPGVEVKLASVDDSTKCVSPCGSDMSSGTHASALSQ
eukprot:TRINITY_DN79173_c0_g1_i1.p1 TRINITY_DN79173_c0_g1~~TRINITY_DN79173_c0_g1_i1.p1  ORF type:complete len:199 (+),score=28.18 TRINITY_DN79173_c0_g1_i1:75-599(+)